MKRLHKEKGAAIVVALFVTALVAALAIAMLERLQIDTRRTELFLNANQAYFYAQGSVAWAKDQLNTNWKNKQTNRLTDKLPIHTSNKQGNAVITSIIEDEQGKFNLNNLTDENYNEDFLRLIKTVIPNIDPLVALGIMVGVVDWIKPGTKGNAINKYYSSLEPPYSAPHRPMVSVSELRLVRDVTPEIFNLLAPYLTALPEVTPINVNTADWPVLLCLSKTMTPAAAKSLVSYMKGSPFVTPEQFAKFGIVKNNPIPENKITMTSNYFLVQSNITIGQQATLLYTLVNRIAKDAETNTLVLWQTKGTL